MRAVVLSEFGPPGNLAAGQVPDPVPGPGQVLVDVGLASITFVETQVRAGRPPNPAMLPQLPAILGNGVGGVVASAGAGVDPALPGRRVVTTTGGSGGYAERAVADASWLIEVPAGLGLADATALLADGRTAVALARGARLAPGETVLVEVAAAALGLLRDGGRFCAFGMASGSFARLAAGPTAGRGIEVIRGAPVGPAQLRALSAEALAAAEAGELKPLIGQTFPLDRAADAHAAIEARTSVGKTLLRAGSAASG